MAKSFLVAIAWQHRAIQDLLVARANASKLGLVFQLLASVRAICHQAISGIWSVAQLAVQRGQRCQGRDPGALAQIATISRVLSRNAGAARAAPARTHIVENPLRLGAPNLVGSEGLDGEAAALTEGNFSGLHAIHQDGCGNQEKKLLVHKNLLEKRQVKNQMFNRRRWSPRPLAWRA
jgi:hypothetical protein